MDRAAAVRLLGDVRDGVESLPTNERWELLRQLAETYAALHQYVDARAVAEECADADIRLRALATILLRYAAERDPRLDEHLVF